MSTRKAHPARTLRELERAKRDLDARYEHRLGAAAWDMASDLAINDGGARLNNLEAIRAQLATEEQDIQAARLIILLRQGTVRPLKNGDVHGTTPHTVQSICAMYPECADEWAARVRALAVTPQ